MTEELKALACLLIYPTKELQSELCEIDSVLQNSPRLSDSTKKGLSIFVQAYRETPLHDIQKNYVSTFDIGKSASLNLFEHLHGDSRERGAAMVNLLKLYRDHGLEVTGGEFPDYLPMVLEFLSGLSWQDAQIWLRSAGSHIQKIDRQLQLLNSPWANVTATLLELALTERDPLKLTKDDLAPAMQADWFDSPVKFANSTNPVEQTIRFADMKKKSC